MARLKKDAWAKPSLKTKEVEVDELGGSVLIRELPAEYSAEVQSNIQLVSEGGEQVARVNTAKMERLQFAYGVVDEQENPMFTEAEVEELQKKHGRAFKTVVAAIDELSGLDKEAIEKAEARFPSSGSTANGTSEGPGDSGASLGEAVTAGDTGPDLPARAGA